MTPKRSGEAGRRLRRPLQALFETSPLDDAVAIAEALPHACLAMLDPEGRDLGFELLELGRKHDVMTFRKFVVQLTAPLGGALDFELDVLDCSHVYVNVEAPADIPAACQLQRPKKKRSRTPAPTRPATIATTLRNVTTTLLVAELADAGLVDPEVVRELVQHGDANLLPELLGIGERLFQR